MQLPVLLILPGMLVGAAGAQVPSPVEGNYVGAAGGALHSGGMNAGAIPAALQAQGLSVRNTAVNDQDSGWKVTAGYRTGPHWAVEGGYTALGRYRQEGQVVQDPGTVQSTLKATAWHLSVLGLLPLGSGMDGFAKAGWALWQTRLDTEGAFSGRGVQSADARGGSPVLGLGAAWRLSNSLSTRLEWERYTRVGRADRTGRVDIDFASLGLQFHF
jgi:OOP family OmpA-OmpF porin